MSPPVASVAATGAPTGNLLASGDTKSIADVLDQQHKLRQSGQYAIFQLRALATEDHTRARQFADILDRARRNPDGRQSTRPLKPVQPLHIQGVALVDARHHQFPQAGIHQLRLSAVRFNVIHHPLPIAHRLPSHRRAVRPLLYKMLIAPTLVNHSPARPELSPRAQIYQL